MASGYEWPDGLFDGGECAAAACVRPTRNAPSESAQQRGQRVRVPRFAVRSRLTHAHRPLVSHASEPSMLGRVGGLYVE
eukprot:scaffold8036_cov128-Isochrysis_galbana.AAC.6